MSEPAVAVRARDLVKRFGDRVAVAGIDLQVAAGESVGILGPNGAGKSSTMRMIGCVSAPSGGTLEVLGLDPGRDGPRIRARIGVVPQRDTLDEELTVRQNLTTYARYFGIASRPARLRAGELLDFVQLSDRADSLVEPLSGGMKRRLTVARALVNEPDLLLLDEPTTGLDPQARHALWERLYRLRERGVTLVLTTHYMDEAEQLCDRIVVMDGGRVVAEGSPAGLVARYSSREVLELRLDAPDREIHEGLLRRVAQRVEALPDRVLLYVDDADVVAAELRRGGVRATGILPRRATLEDVFLRLTGRSLDA
ncbi:MAG: ABC transporter ATP-binding protein [Kineosporiaceae bacterium]